MQKLIHSLDTAHGTILIRKATPADVVQFRDLRLLRLQDSPTAFGADYQTELCHPMSYWESRLIPSDYDSVFFAEHEETIIGMSGIHRGEFPKTRHSAYVWGIYVCAEWRGLHIAEMLIETCADWARQHDVAILKLGVMANNESAIRCYKRCGFTSYGLEPRALLYEGAYYDELLMSRSLE